MTKSEKIKAEIERRMDLFQKEKDELPITTETRIARSILSARIGTHSKTKKRSSRGYERNLVKTKSND